MQLFYHIEVKTINELFLISEVPPSVNHFLAYRAIIKNGKPLAMSYKTPEAAKYRADFANYVKEEVIKQNWTLVPNKTRHFYVDAVAYFPRTDMDISNYWKVLLDAITDTQLIWVDDNVVCERAQRIMYDSSNPRFEIWIRPVDYIGVFDNASQLDEFETNCIGCTRYSRNCSLLNKAKLGYIQEEIADGVCSKYKRIKGVK